MPARYPIPLDAILDNTGTPLAGASVLIRNRATGTNAVVYTAETGPGTTVNPLAADTAGRVAGWVDPGHYEAVITASGYGPRTVPFSLGVATVTASAEVLPLPVGTIIAYGGATAPAGWMICDGSAVSRTSYGDLYAAIGTRYGVGDGSTTFNLPDLRGRAPIGAGQGTGLTTRSLGAAGGSETVALTEAQLAPHGHTGTAAATGSAHKHDFAITDQWADLYYQGGSSARQITIPTASWRATTTEGAHTHPVTVGNTGAGDAHPNMPPFLAVNHVIRAVSL